MSDHNRRDFLKRAAVGSLAAFTIAGTKASGRVLGANNRVRIALAGINSRGQEHLKGLSEIKDDVEIAYLVDPDSRLFPMKSKFVQDRFGNTPACVQDLRKALDDKSLDAVAIATPNHWHTLLSIWACQAGKDVYVEKPCSHTIREGQKLVEAARRYDRIVQHGTQGRSNSDLSKLMAIIASGKYGKLQIAYGYASKPRKSIGFKQPKEPPKELDFDIWLGPAPEQPYHENIVPYNWHWFWDFGNGEIGNQGVHQMDIARWAMPQGAAPKSVVSLGGRFGYKDQGQTPNTQLTIIDFGNAKIFFEDRGLVNEKQFKVTDEFYTDEGVLKNGKFYPKGKTEGEVITVDGSEVPFNEFADELLPRHFANFVDCVRSRKRENLNAEILEGHLSTMLCHLGNVSYRLGTDVSFLDPVEAFGGDAAAHEAWESMKQHLVDANVDLESCACRLGRKLTFDAQAEKFVGDDEANKLLTQSYRPPYVLPEQV
jgi:predicted dehydrogenase